MYGIWRIPLILIVLLCTATVSAQEVGLPAGEVGDTTQEILDNVASQQKPQAVILEKESCTFLGFIEVNCPAPKVDYTHADLLPQERQVSEEGLSFWQKIGSFLSGLFEKSSDRESGYGYTYLPQAVTPVQDVGNSLQLATEQTHETIKKTYLPQALIGKITPVSTSDGNDNVPDTGQQSTGIPGSTPGSAKYNSTANFAKSLVEIGGKSCGWSAVNVRTKTLSCNNGCGIPGDYDDRPIRCINGKVKPDVYLDLELSANSNSWLQCVGFVIGVEQGMGKVLVSRNAKDYCLAGAPAGYVYVNKGQIQAGDIVANTKPPWGHVMTIIQVNKGSSSYDVAEANWTVSGSMGTRTIGSDQIDCVLRRK